MELVFRPLNNPAPAYLPGPSCQCSPFQGLCSLSLPAPRVPHSPCFPTYEGIHVYYQPAASLPAPSVLTCSDIAPAHMPYTLPLSQPGSSPSGHLLLPIPSSLYHPHGLYHPHLPGPRPVSRGNDFSWQRLLEPFPPTVTLTHVRLKSIKGE